MKIKSFKILIQIQRGVSILIVMMFFAESLDDSSFRKDTTPGDTCTQFKGIFNEVCQVLDYKKFLEQF